MQDKGKEERRVKEEKKESIRCVLSYLFQGGGGRERKVEKRKVSKEGGGGERIFLLIILASFHCGVKKRGKGGTEREEGEKSKYTGVISYPYPLMRGSSLKGRKIGGGKEKEKKFQKKRKGFAAKAIDLIATTFNPITRSFGKGEGGRGGGGNAPEGKKKKKSIQTAPRAFVSAGRLFVWCLKGQERGGGGGRGKRKRKTCYRGGKGGGRQHNLACAILGSEAYMCERKEGRRGGEE